MLSIPQSADHADLREGVRAVCNQFDNAYWQRIDEARGYPDAFVRALTEAGWLSALIPEEYGGAGLPLLDACLILQEINQNGASAVHCHAQMYTMASIMRHGSEAQKRRTLPRIADGSLRLQAFGVTEPDAGTDTSRISTRADKGANGDYVVNGHKIWTTKALESEVVLLLARTDPRPEARFRGLSLFLADLDRDHCTIRPIPKMGRNAVASCEVFYDSMPVEAWRLVGQEGEGFSQLLHGLNPERILLAAEAIGIGEVALRRAVNYAKAREVFGRPIGANQGVQFPIARAYVNVEAASLMRYRACALFDAGQPCGAQANMAKLLAADASWEAANVCLQTHGGYGFAADYDIERKFRETRLYQVAPVSTNLVFAYLAEHVLGLPRSGTTKLQRFLSADPNLQATPAWAMWNPNHDKTTFSPIYAEGRPLGLYRQIEERERVNETSAGLTEFRDAVRAGLL